MIACQPELDVRHQQQPGPAVGRLRSAQLGRGPLERLLEEAEGVLNGLFTNDKFCLTRRGHLRLTWWRFPLRGRGKAARCDMAAPVEEAQRGGSDETAMARPPAAAAPPRRAAPVGPSLPAAPRAGAGDAAGDVRGDRTVAGRRSSCD